MKQMGDCMAQQMLAEDTEAAAGEEAAFLGNAKTLIMLKLLVADCVGKSGKTKSAAACATETLGRSDVAKWALFNDVMNTNQQDFVQLVQQNKVAVKAFLTNDDLANVIHVNGQKFAEMAAEALAG